MQDDVSELLRSAIREYQQTKVCFSPTDTLIARNAAVQGRWCHKHPPTSRPQAALHYCTVCDDRISQWMGPNGRPADKWSAPVYIKICWRPTWELHYVHFAALGLSPALVNTTLWYCPALVLTLCWQRHKWELTLEIETGIFHFTYPQREMCWACGNVYIRQSDIFSFRWSCNGNWRKKGNCLLKCISP